MDRSVFIARFAGPLLALIGLDMVLDPDGYLAMVGAMIGNGPLLYLTAILGLLAGLALILSHNLWTLDWRLLLTLLGWLAVFDSTIWLLAPERMAWFWGPLLEETALALGLGVLALLLGGAFIYFGYVADNAAGDAR